MTRFAGWHRWILLLLLASCASTPAPKPPVPFHLTPDEQTSVDRLLGRWEQWNAGVKTFRCRFKRWTYDSVFGPQDQPKSVELGTIEYAAPGRAVFRVETTEKDGKESPISAERAEHWLLDGESLWEYRATKKQVIEHRLPPELAGSRLVDGPLSFEFPVALFSGLPSLLGTPLPPAGHFPFGTKAKELKRHYYIRTITPADRKNEVWIEAYPRSAQLAAALQKIELIFAAGDMSPVALRITQCNGKDYTVYRFFDVVVNEPPSEANDDPFDPAVPPGWRKIVDAPPAEARRGPNEGRR